MIGIIGPLAKGVNVADGHVSVVRNLTSILEKHFPNEVLVVDSYFYKNHPIIKTKEVIRACKKCNYVIILMGQKGLKLVLPICAALKKYNNYKLVYRIIGSWLPGFINTHKKYKKYLNKVDKMYAEIGDMISCLKEQGIDNVECMRNFSMHSGKGKKKEINDFSEPYKLCTFSGITAEKGIDIAIDTVAELNKKAGYIKYELHLHGSFFDDGYQSHILNKLKEKENKGCTYDGFVGENVIDRLSEYNAMLFPTYYAGEGIPGAVVDSIVAGTPILASDWKYNSEVIKDGLIGYLYETKKGKDGLMKIVELYFENIDHACEMSANCLEEAKKYNPDEICKPLIDYLRENRDKDDN